MKDLYKILGVEEDASADTIKKKYRKLAKENHPDATGGDKKKTERFKDIGEAYGILGDEKKRQEYDRLKHMPVGADGIPQGFDPDAFAQAFGGGAGGFRGSNVHVSGGDFGDLGDVFASLFGGQMGGANPFGGARVRTRAPPNGLAPICPPNRLANTSPRSLKSPDTWTLPPRKPPAPPKAWANASGSNP